MQQVELGLKEQMNAAQIKELALARRRTLPRPRRLVQVRRPKVSGLGFPPRPTWRAIGLKPSSLFSYRHHSTERRLGQSRHHRQYRNPSAPAELGRAGSLRVADQGTADADAEDHQRHPDPVDGDVDFGFGMKVNKNAAMMLVKDPACLRRCCRPRLLTRATISPMQDVANLQR